MKCKVKIENGQIMDPAAIRGLFAKLDDGDYILTVRTERGQISKEQRGLYWTWLGIVQDATGYWADILHEMNKALFLDLLCNDHEFSSENLGPALYSKYMEFVQLYYHENAGIILTNEVNND